MPVFGCLGMACNILRIAKYLRTRYHSHWPNTASGSSIYGLTVLCTPTPTYMHGQHEPGQV
jgi:hypothetical protein